MQHVSGRLRDLPPSFIEDIGRYRHDIFVDRLGWRLNSNNGLERDEFDDDCAAIYVSSRDGDGRINGVARLLPTTSPYLLERVFPQLLEGQLPRDPAVWELSRFAAMDVRAGRLSRHQASAGHAAHLFRKAVEVAAQNGAHALLVVTPIVVERLLRRRGFHCVRMGSPSWHQNEFIVALQINCEEVLSGVRRRAMDACAINQQ